MNHEEFVCKGSLQLGSGCRKCSRCFAELSAICKEQEERADKAERALDDLKAACDRPSQDGPDGQLMTYAEHEQFIQAAVDKAPEPLRRLGEYLSKVLDEDQWATAERMLLGAALDRPSQDDRATVAHAGGLPTQFARRDMADDEIMKFFDRANTPCIVTSAHSPWHQKVIIRFARILLEDAEERYQILKDDYDMVKESADSGRAYAYEEGVKVGRTDPHSDRSSQDDSAPYMIVFDDADRKPEMLFGRERALRRYKDVSVSWNAHLFVKIDSNSRDCQIPNARDRSFRRAQVLVGGTWKDIEFNSIKAGQQFRLFEPSGESVFDPEGFASWVADTDAADDAVMCSKPAMAADTAAPQTASDHPSNS